MMQGGMMQGGGMMQQHGGGMMQGGGMPQVSYRPPATIPVQQPAQPVPLDPQPPLRKGMLCLLNTKSAPEMSGKRVKLLGQSSSTGKWECEMVGGMTRQGYMMVDAKYLLAYSTAGCQDSGSMRSNSPLVVTDKSKKK